MIPIFPICPIHPDQPERPDLPLGYSKYALNLKIRKVVSRLFVKFILLFIHKLSFESISLGNSESEILTSGMKIYRKIRSRGTGPGLYFMNTCNPLDET